MLTTNSKVFVPAIIYTMKNGKEIVEFIKEDYNSGGYPYASGDFGNLSPFKEKDKAEERMKKDIPHLNNSRPLFYHAEDVVKKEFKVLTLTLSL